KIHLLVQIYLIYFSEDKFWGRDFNKQWLQPLLEGNLSVNKNLWRYMVKKAQQYVLVSLCFIFLALAGCSKETEEMAKMEPETEEVFVDWEERDKFVKGEKVLFGVYPDPGLTAGRPYGYMFSFTESFESFNGKELAIYAHHKETGERIAAVKPEIISESSTGYPSLERFTVSFEIPYKGIWRYEVVLNDQFYGDVVLDIRGWKSSPFFTLGGYTMIGEKDRIGFIHEDTLDARFHPNKGNKYMWHFWGKESEFDGELKVIATHESSWEQITLIAGSPLGGPNNTADIHVPSNMSLPMSGMWKLEAYFGDEYFGNVFVEVYEKQ
ncbi:hypothetical protein ACOI1C_22320, partial [Bacillus sp. DJP31]|uniref:hypothetical protein n=1 Tax=Bacillus sp. DJP31 TaxID=3409789 RepID=UPI003BB621A3